MTVPTDVQDAWIGFCGAVLSGTSADVVDAMGTYYRVVGAYGHDGAAMLPAVICGAIAEIVSSCSGATPETFFATTPDGAPVDPDNTATIAEQAAVIAGRAIVASHPDNSGSASDFLRLVETPELAMEVTAVLVQTLKRVLTEHEEHSS